MIQTLKKIFASLIISATLFAPFVAPAVVSAAAAPNPDCSGTSTDIQGCLKTGACLSTSTADCPAEADPNGGVQNIITTIINVFSLVVGVVAVIMIIVGGIRFVTSGGDSGNVSAARNTIIYAIVGLVIVALAQVIVHFVLARVAP